MQVRRRREIPREDVLAGVVHHRVVGEAQPDLWGEQDEACRVGEVLGAHVVEQRERQTAPSGVAGEDEPIGLQAVLEQPLEHRRRIEQPRRERELRREAVVGSEDRATRRAGDVGVEGGVHGGAGADVAAAVQVEHRALRRSLRALVRVVPDARHPRDLGAIHGDVERPHRGRHDDPAQVVDEYLDRAELLGGQRGRIAHEAAHHLAGHADSDVVRQAVRSAPGRPERHAAHRQGHLFHQARHRERGDRCGCRLDVTSPPHDHAARLRVPTPGRGHPARVMAERGRLGMMTPCDRSRPSTRHVAPTT